MLTRSAQAGRRSTPPWIVNRLANLDLNQGPIARYFEYLSHDGTAKAKDVLFKADQVVDNANLDDELLDTLLAGLNL